jgi:hypothetical protein
MKHSTSPSSSEMPRNISLAGSKSSTRRVKNASMFSPSCTTSSQHQYPVGYAPGSGVPLRVCRGSPRRWVLSGCSGRASEIASGSSDGCTMCREAQYSKSFNPARKRALCLAIVRSSGVRMSNAVCSVFEYRQPGALAPQDRVHVLLVGLDAGLAERVDADEPAFDHGGNHQHLEQLSQGKLVEPRQVDVGRGPVVL